MDYETKQEELKAAIANAQEQPQQSENQNVKTFQLVVFRLGGEEYGMLIDEIKEVVLTPQITRMPQVASFIKGVANIRGNILAIIDLEERFGISDYYKDKDENYGKYTLVLENNDYNVGILVKEVPNTIQVSENDFDDSPNIVHGNSVVEHAVKGVVKKEQRLIIMIDMKKIMSYDDLYKNENKN